MAILKLQNEGDTHTARVTGCSEVAGNFGPQVKFTFEGGDDLFLPKDSADRQLARIPLSYAECVGETLTFSRDPNSRAGAKPYWGIRLAGAAEKAPPSKRLTHAEASGGPSIGRMPFDDEGAPPLSDEDNPYADPGPLPPFHKAGKAAEVAPISAKRAALFDDYMALTAQVRKHSGHTSDEAIQATTFSIFKMWRDGGLA